MGKSERKYGRVDTTARNLTFTPRGDMVCYSVYGLKEY